MRKIKGTNIQSFDDDERAYILHRPAIYIGSTTEATKYKFVYLKDKLVKEAVRLNSGLYKIIDEVITNAVDNAIDNNFKLGNKINVTWDSDEGCIVVEDNGSGIATIKDSKTKKYLPELVFTSLRTGSNLDDSKVREGGGMNGVGVSLTNIFCTKFVVTTVDGKNVYTQTYEDNCKVVNPPIIKKASKSTPKGTRIEFYPDFKYFKVSNKCYNDLGVLITKRVKDLSFCNPEITFNNTKNVTNLLADINSVYSFAESPKVRLGVVKNNTDEFESISFVNGCETHEGTHVDYVTSKVVERLKTFIKKKHKIEVKTIDIKKHILVLIALRMESPAFDSQTKTKLESDPESFKDRIDPLITNKFLKSVEDNEELIDSVIEIYQLREGKKEDKKLRDLQGKKLSIPKYIPATNKRKSQNILFIAEGDSAISTLSRVKKPNHAGFPIRGKFINALTNTPVKVLSNEEANMIMQINNLKIGQRIIPKKLNFGTIAFLTDQDHDGNGIAGLLLNFFYKFWPEIFDHIKIIRVLSPLYIAKKKKEVKRFYDHNSYNQWANDGSWSIDYNKGLGSLGKDEYKHMIDDMHYYEFVKGEKTEETIEMVYGKEAFPRKRWLMEN